MAGQADIDALTAAMGRGLTEVRFSDGRRIVYQSVDQMRSAIAAIREQSIDGDDRTVFAEFDRS